MKTLVFGLMALLAPALYAQQPVALTATIAYNNEAAAGDYSIFSSGATTLSQVDKPIIIVEGFDPTNDLSGSEIAGLFDEIRGNKLGLQLASAGYDVIVLNFTKGGDYIQRNAFLLVELINQVNAQKQGSEPITVIGLSTGGIIARYALAWMEPQKSNRFLMAQGQTMRTLA